LYDPPPFGNVSLVHITDVHAQLLPIHFREPNVNIGDGHPPHLVGKALLRHYGIAPGTAQAHASTSLDFAAAAHRYGRTVDFEDPVFTPYALREGIAIIGQAFPYTPIAHPRHYFPEWSFGIQEARLQKLVDEVRAKGARAVVLLSHNGMDVDLKLARRVR